MMGRMMFGLVGLAMLACMAEGMRLSLEERKYLTDELQDLLGVRQGDQEPESCTVKGDACDDERICGGTPKGLKCLKTCTTDGDCLAKHVCFVPEGSSQGRCRKKPDPEKFRCNDIGATCTKGCPPGAPHGCECVEPKNAPSNGQSGGGHCLPVCYNNTECCPPDDQSCGATCSPDKEVCPPPMRRHKPKPCPEGTCDETNCPDGYSCTCQDPPGGSNQAGVTGGQVCIPSCNSAGECPCPQGNIGWCDTECNASNNQCENPQAVANNSNVRRARLVAKMVELLTRDNGEDIEID